MGSLSPGRYLLHEVEVYDYYILSHLKYSKSILKEEFCHASSTWFGNGYTIHNSGYLGHLDARFVAVDRWHFPNCDRYFGYFGCC